MVNDERYMEIRDEVLAGLRDMILKASDCQRALAVPSRDRARPHPPDAWAAVWRSRRSRSCLGYMNNLAYACGMKPVFRFSYYVGTFSEYDLGVIPRA